MLFGHQMEVSNGARLPTFAYSDDSKAPPALAKDGSGAGLPAAFLTTNPVADGAADGGDGAAPGAQRVDWGPFWMGCWPFLAVELVTGCYFFQVRQAGGS